MADLSVFVDESGDFGDFTPAVPFYIVSLVIHDQSKSITLQLDRLTKSLAAAGVSQGSIHTRPLLRHEPPYEHLTIEQQRFLLNRLLLFAKKCPLTYAIFSFERRFCRQPENLEFEIKKTMRAFFVAHHDLFTTFDRVILYYDDGQKRLSRILTEAIDDVLPNLEHRHIDVQVYREYRLAQVADLLCCIELSKCRYDRGIPTKSESLIFGARRDFERSFYRGIQKRRLA